MSDIVIRGTKLALRLSEAFGKICNEEGFNGHEQTYAAAAFCGAVLQTLTIPGHESGSYMSACGIIQGFLFRGNSKSENMSEAGSIH